MRNCAICLLAMMLLLQACVPLDEMISSPMKKHVAMSRISIMKQLEQSEQEQGQIRLLVLGDSVALGKGSTQNGRGYAWYVSKFLERQHLDVQYINRAVSGQTSADLLHRLRVEEKLQHEVAQADLILVTIGGNDLLQTLLKEKNPWKLVKRFPAIQTRYRENMHQILQLLHARNRHAVVMLTSLYNPVDAASPFHNKADWLIRRWNHGLEEVVSPFDQTIVVNLEAFLPSSQLADQIHPNDQGYRWIGAKCVQALKTNTIPSSTVQPVVHRRQRSVIDLLMF
ncbi:GDSL-type esterase/lipase family protein [Lihuaxuella thermophila]|uniref:Lysophospholipase L1 n=1 Tax=Lihuaxuella thermophila TaxID=1173111 RepID=A0A1H8ECJ1_9BACL|nr:GDSL-type esterase/lipase family protein [Lihuaxuella thermophila]SEN16468.1 Lysophospholipase L1 [Lihuaxuella thermophila]